MFILAIELCLARVRHEWLRVRGDLLMRECVDEVAQSIPFVIILLGICDAFSPKLSWYSYFPNVCFIALGLVYYLRQWWFGRRLQAWADDFYSAQMELTMSKVMARAKADLAAYPEQWDGSSFRPR